MNKSVSPVGIRVIAIVNRFAFILTLVFWLLGLAKGVLPAPDNFIALPERANAATTRGFMIADLVWAVPLLFLTAIGIWQRRPWGWMTAHMVNILWCYSLTVVLIRDAYSTLSPGAVLFLPFALFAVWSSIYLWIRRVLFWPVEHH